MAGLINPGAGTGAFVRPNHRENAHTSPAPRWAVPPVVGVPCGVPSPGDFEEWGALKAQAVALGFPVT